VNATHYTGAQLSADERLQLRDALRVPRGHYTAERAGQLSGVPTRTVYHWASQGVLIPDYYQDSPKSWSYRDLVYLRLTAWLRTHQMPLDDTQSLVRNWREEFESADEFSATTISTDGVGIGIGSGFDVDALSGQRVLETMVDVVATFDLLAPITVTEFGRARLWGPNLVRPSAETAMNPWVMRGEPVVRGSRISTGALYALTTSRRLPTEGIVALYPGLTSEAVDDAVELESRLRQAA